MPRSRILTHERFARVPPPDLAQRELTAIREVLHAFLHADRPEEVFQFALDRVSPLIGASFASVYLVDGVSELMRLAAASNWPPKHKRWLGEMRVRMGFGPSGEAAAERRIIEVPDVTSDRSVEDWAEVANELGFRSLVALPLEDAGGALGTVTFYFAEPGTPPPDRRDLMRLLADLMAAAAGKVRLVDDLRRARAALTDANAELEQQYAEVRLARRARDEFLRNASEHLRVPLTQVIAGLDEHSGGGAASSSLEHARTAADQLLWRIDELLEYAATQAGPIPVELEPFPARDVAGAARALVESLGARVRVEPGPGAEGLGVHSDRRKVTRILASLLLTGSRMAEEGEMTLSWAGDLDRVRFRVHTPARGIPRDGRDAFLEEFRSVEGLDGGTGVGLGLAHRLAAACGGSVEVTVAPGEGVTFALDLPGAWEATAD